MRCARASAAWVTRSVERGKNALGDVFDAPCPVDAAEQASLLVVRQELGGHAFVGFEAVFDDFLLVVRPMFKVGAGGGGLYFKW